MKTHWKKLNNPNYLGAYEIMGTDKDLIVTIKSVAKELVKGTDGKEEERTVAKIVDQKPMILNATNCKAITKALNTPFIEEWANNKVSLYVAKIKAFGEMVDALRIRPEPPELPKPNATQLEAIKEAIAANQYTKQQIEKKYNLDDIEL